MENKTKNKIKNTIITLIILFIAICVGIDIRAEFLEIKEIGENYISVFVENLKYQYIMFLTIFVALFVIFSINTKIIKNGLKKFFMEDKVDMPKLPNFSISSIIAILGGLIGQNFLMESYKLCLNNAWFGIEDSVFGKDIGYYVFILPFVKKVIFFTIGIFALMLIYTAIYYVLTLNTYLDGVRLETLKKNTFIKQLIIFAMIIVVLISTLIWIGSKDILTEQMLTIKSSESTELIGASMADVTVKVWGYRILSILIILDVLVLLKFIKKGNFKKCVLIVSVVPIYLICMFLCLIYIKEIYLGSNELDKEKQYISYNINNTKKAYDIDIEQIELNDYDTINYEEVSENKDLIENIPLINTEILETAITEHQDNSVYYKYSDTNISLYDFENTNKLIYLTPRQILTDSIRTYNNKTFEYTHGYSAVASSINNFDKNGYINYYNSEILDKNLKINEPRIYFGTGDNGIIVTNSKYGKEYDYPISVTVNQENIYGGKAGLNLNFIDRLILGFKNNNLKLAFSTYINKNSKIITNKNIVERARTILPDIVYDENPYLVIKNDGSLVWVVDGYTMTNSYPYSQTQIITLPNGEREKINYIRNSVKVLIDAYDGTVEFYITDKSDPIIAAYQNMYPELFKFEIPEDVKKQFIYPKYLYNIQAEILRIYHDISEDVLYRGDDIWAITNQTTLKTSKIDPYYTMVKTIDNNDYNLGLVVTYNKFDKQNIISYLVGTYENGEAKLSLYKFKSDSNVAGIVQLNNQIEEDEIISKELETINITGTKLIKNIIIVPINNTLLYVEPVYQVMLNENSQIPILKKIIVASGNKVAIGNDLEEAINNLFTDYSVEISTHDTEDIDSIIDSIIKANANLKESMNLDDFGLIGKDIDTLRELIDKLELLMNNQEENNTNDNQEEEIIEDKEN